MENPYSSPSSNLGGRDSFSQSKELSPRTLDIMDRTRPWAMLCAVVLLATAGIALLQMVAPNGGGAANMVGSIIQVILNLYLGVTLMAYASRIKLLVGSRKASDLERALDSHRTYWKVNGVLILIGAIFIIGAMVLGLAVTTMR
jgi:uncharacterized membrane protein